jgi:hypothetical protein
MNKIKIKKKMGLEWNLPYKVENIE